MSEPVWSAYTTAGANTDDGTAKWTTLADLAPAAPALDLDLTNPATASQLTCVRASAAYADNLAGVWTSFAPNVPRITNKGLRQEQSATNSIRNNSMQGAVAGTPGTLPTFWDSSQQIGITQQVVGMGVENGIEYIDIRLSGLAVNTPFIEIDFDASSATAVVNGQTWVASAFMAIKAGSVAGFVGNNAYFGHGVYTSGGAYIADLGTGVPFSLLTSTLTRFVNRGTIASATAARIKSYIYFDDWGGPDFDFTFRIGWPQLERAPATGQYVTSPIRTTSAAVTRSAETITVNGFSAWHTAGPGTLFFESLSDYPSVHVAGEQGRLYYAAGGSWAWGNEFYFDETGYWDAVYNAAGGVVSEQQVVLANAPHFKAAEAWAASDRQLYANGIAAAHVSTALPTHDTLELGNSVAGTSGTVTRVSYWPSRLTDAYLAELTALPAIDLDLTKPATASQLTCVRSTVGYHDNLAGVWSSFPVNTPRITDRGLRSEEARTNSIRNNSGQGVVGSPPTLPNFWSFVHAGGIIDPASVSTGVENGIEYVDIRIVGEAGLGFELDLESIVTAANGQTWFASAFFAIKSGSPPAGLYFGIGLFNGASWLGDLGTILLSTFTSTLTRYTIGGKIANASVNGVQPYFYVDPSASATDFTIRIGWPQMEKASNSGNADLPWSTSPIRTTSAAVTRAEDRVTVNGFVSWYVPGSPGTVFVEGKDDAPVVNYSSPVFIGDWNGTYIEVAYDVDSSFVLLWNGAVQIGLTVVNDPVHYRTATAWALNDGQYYFNGKASIHDTSVALPIFPTSPSTASVVALGVSYTGGYGLSGPLTRFTYWNSRLPDSLLGKLTGKGNWAAPHARLANAWGTNWGQPGNTVFVADEHNEVRAGAITITSNTGPDYPLAQRTNKILCVDRYGSVPPVEADLRRTAVVKTTGNNVLTFDGQVGTYLEGFTLSAGSGAVAANLEILGICSLKNCVLARPGTDYGSVNLRNAIIGGWQNRGGIVLDNVKFITGSDWEHVWIYGVNVLWMNSPDPIGGVPNIGAYIFSNGGRVPAVKVTVINCDFSILPPEAGVFQFDLAWDQYTIINSKIPPGMDPFWGGPWGRNSGSGLAINCDSGATNYLSMKRQFEGTQTSETTVVRTGGSTDGTTPMSWKIVTYDDIHDDFPFESLPLSFWNDSVGAKTIVIYGYWDNASVPLNTDIWIEADYLGSASSTLGSTVSSGKTSVLATGTPIPIDTLSVWGGGDVTTRFKMSVTLNAMKGMITIRVKVAKPSATFFIDPRPEINGISIDRSWMVSTGTYINELGGGGVPFSRLQLGH